MGKNIAILESEREFVRKALEGEIDWQQIPGSQNREQRHVLIPHYVSLFCLMNKVSLSQVVMRGVSEINLDHLGTTSRGTMSSRIEFLSKKWADHAKVCPLLNAEKETDKVLAAKPIVQSDTKEKPKE